MNGSMTSVKQCGRCKQEKLENEFYDMQSWCKPCCREYQKRRREKQTMKKLLFATVAMLALATNTYAADPQVSVSVVKVNTQLYESLKQYKVTFLVQVETKAALQYLSLSCTGFNDADQPVGEMLVDLHTVPTNERVYQQEDMFWTDKATSVKCRVKGVQGINDLNGWHPYRPEETVPPASTPSTKSATTDDSKLAYGLAAAVAYESFCKSGTFTAGTLKQFKNMMRALPVTTQIAAVNRVTNQMEKSGDKQWCDGTAPIVKQFEREVSALKGGI